MAKQAGRSQEEIQALNQAAQEFLTTVASMSLSLKENARRIASESGEAQQKSIINTTKAVNLAKELKTFTREQLADKKTLSKFESKIADTKGIQVGIEAEIQQLLSKQIATSEDLTEEELKRLETLTNAREEFKGIVGEAEKLQDTLKDIDNQVNLFDNIANFVKDIPGLSRVFGEFEKAANSAREAAAKGGDSLTAGAKELSSAAGKAALGGFFGFLTKGFRDGQINITQFSRQLNISRQSANILNKDLQKLGRTVVGATGNDFVEATLQLSNNLGATAQMSNESVVSFTTLTKQLGMSAEAASNLAKFSAASGQEIENLNSSIVGTVLAQNAITDSGIRYQDVLNDIANTSAATQLITSKFPGGIAKAAFEARRFGLTLSSLENSAAGLLDFESSIAGELEAELLTGRQLNLERARMAALTGDTATLAKELAANFGNAEEFSKLNVIQQQALAKSMGMSREELAKTLQQQEALSKFGVTTSVGLKKEVAEREKGIRALEKAGKFEEARLARQQLYTDLGDEELGRQRQNQSLMESQAELLQDIASAAQSIAKPFDLIGSILQKMSSASFGIFGTLGKIGSKLISLGSYFGEAMTKNVDEAVTAAKGFFPKLMGALKIGGKGGTKALLKKIPVIGLLVGAGMAIKRMSDGDILGGLMELGSGVASLFPGVGTGISIGMDAALLGTDVAGITGENRKVSSTGGLNVATSAIGGTTQMSNVWLAEMVKYQQKAVKAAEDTKQAVEMNRHTYLNGRRIDDAQKLQRSKFDR